MAIVLVVIVFSGVAIVICNEKVDKTAIGRTYFDITEVPYKKVGLLLGTSKYVAGRQENLYYHFRIDAALKLIKSGKIKYVIISGDNGRKEYNEPEMMRRDLIDSGVDSTTIYLDYAGFRTFDSMIRLKEIFSQSDVTIISQKFHNERALYIAYREGINAIGFNAKDVHANTGLKVQVREKLARVKLFIDYLIDTEPKFLGEKITIPD